MGDAFTPAAASVCPLDDPYQAFPLPAQAAAPGVPRAVPGYAADHAGPPEPLGLPWALRSMRTAEHGVDTLADGRTRYWIRHEVLLSSPTLASSHPGNPGGR